MTPEQASTLTVVATIDGVLHNLTFDETTGRFVASVPAPQHSSYPEDGHKFQISISAGGSDYVLPDVTDNHEDIKANLQLRVKETTAPVIQPVYPVDNESILTATPTITWRLVDSDAGVNLSTLTASLNGIPVPTADIQVQGNLCSYSPSRLSAGQSILEYSVADNDGNASTQQISFSVDTPAPELIVAEPQDNLLTNKAVIHVIGRAREVSGMYPPFSVSIAVNTVDQGVVTVDADGYFDKLIHLQHGENEILVTAKDSIGAAAHKLLHATVDQILPVFISIDMKLNEDMRTCTLYVNVIDE